MKHRSFRLATFGLLLFAAAPLGVACSSSSDNAGGNAGASTSGAANTSGAMGQHWAAWDIPASATKLPKGTTALTGDLTGGKQTNKYLAPCPSGDDTYEFTVYALSTATLTVSGAQGSGTANSAGVAKVLAALHALTPLGTAKLHGTSGAMGK